MASNLVQYVIDIATGTAKKNVAGLEDSVENLNTELKKTTATSKETKKSLKDNFDTIKTNALGAAVAIAGMATAAFKTTTRVIDLVNNLNDLSVRSGLATDTIQALEQAMKASGQPAEGLNEILNAMAGQFAQLSKQGSEVEKKFASFGIAVKNSNGDLRSNNDILLDVIDQLQGIEDNSVRSRRAVFLLGESGAKLNQALASGEFNDFLEFTREFGVNTGKEASQAAAQFQSSLSALSVVFNGTLQQLVSAGSLQERFLSLIVETGAALAFVKSLTSSFANTLSFLSDTFFNVLFSTKSLIDVFIDLVDFFGLKLPNTIQIAVDFIGTKLTDAFKKVSDVIVGPFTKAFDFVINKLSDYLSAVFNILNDIAKTIGIDFIAGFDNIVLAFEKASESADNFRKSSLKVPDLNKKTSAITSNLQQITNETNDTTEAIRTLNDVLKDIAGKFGIKILDTDKLLQDLNIVFNAIENRFADVFDSQALNTRLQQLQGLIGTTFLETGEEIAQYEIIDETRLQKVLRMLKIGLTKIGIKTDDIFKNGFFKGFETKFGKSISTALSQGLTVAVGAISGFFALLGLAERIGSQGSTQKEIKQNIEEDIRARAKAISLGLQVLPSILFDVFPPLFRELSDSIGKAIGNLLQNLINRLAEFLKSPLDKIGDRFRENNRQLNEQGVVASIKEFFRRYPTFRSGGKYIPSARGGLRFTGEDGLAMLHRNEFVVPETGQAPQGVQRTMMNMGQGNITININSAVVERNAIDELVRQIERRFSTFGSSTSPLFGG